MRLWRLSQHRTRPSTLSLFHLATSFQCASSHPFIFARLSLTTRGSGNARLCWPSLRPSQELSQVLDFFIKANLSCPLSSCSLPSFSDWCVVFVFSASLSAFDPSSPILFPACWCWLLVAMSATQPPSSLLAHISDPVIGVLCWSSMHRSVLLLLLLQCR